MDGTRIWFPKPLYLVACSVTSDPTLPYEPILREVNLDAGDALSSFDPELAPILPALWYALHLPKTRFEVLDQPLSQVRRALHESRHHQIMLVATDVLLEPWLVSLLGQIGEPILILCHDDDLDAAIAATETANFVLPPAATSSLSQASLDAHWAEMSEHWSDEWPVDLPLNNSAPRWTSEIGVHGSEIPYYRILRALGASLNHPEVAADGRGEPHHLLHARAWAEAWADLEDQGVEPAALESQMDAALGRARSRLRAPLALSLPGVAPRYRRMVRDLARATSDPDPSASPGTGADTAAVAPDRTARKAIPNSPADDPPEVLSLMIAHQAASDDSMGLLFPDPIPDAAFVALAELERHWANNPQPRSEGRLHDRLDAAMRPFWTDSVLTAVRTASRIDAYTNFPIGLLRMPGHTAPLAALQPIAYRPINPLTRALQLEFSPKRIVDLSQGMRVLVVECIPDTDTVGRLSAEAWSATAAKLNDPTRSVSVAHVSAADKAELAAAVSKHRPDVLVISAHGAYDPETNGAGLVIGNEYSMGDDLGPMPPMVILSACHSGPRGAGPVSICDLLLRAGAGTVLSTLVPVRVDHNSKFMSRFLMYMSECIGGVEDHQSVLDLWHRVQAGTVIFDIIGGNPRLYEWGYTPTRRAGSDAADAPIVAFMRDRARGRIRPQHLYQDAEAVLLDIADEQNQRSSVANWLRTPGYLPESMMYTFVGDPSTILLRPPEHIGYPPPTHQTR